jgi:hypothetical protein
MKPDEFPVLAYGKRCIPALLGLERIPEELLRIGSLRRAGVGEGQNE